MIAKNIVSVTQLGTIGFSLKINRGLSNVDFRFPLVSSIDYGTISSLCKIESNI
jgi:hypothetical protein